MVIFARQQEGETADPAARQADDPVRWRVAWDRANTLIRESHNHALKWRRALLIWLDEEMVWVAPKLGTNRQPPVFSNAAVRFCLMVKALRGPLSCRAAGRSACVAEPVEQHVELRVALGVDQFTRRRVAAAGDLAAKGGQRPLPFGDDLLAQAGHIPP
ncbi:Transposase DDE domain-containing protein [Rhodobacter sp. 24-YEA-8]|nr:Transposase DDE domain-containing protein [Rhodobacter sp. 24-YEA-8]